MLLCDLKEGLVEHIAEDRKQESPDCYYAGLTPKQLDTSKTVEERLFTLTYREINAWYDRASLVNSHSNSFKKTLDADQFVMLQ